MLDPTPTDPCNVRLEDVSKIYKVRNKRKVVLDRVNFCFPRGVNVAVLGLNGAGKSTLIRLIAGAEEPTSGRIIRNARISWPLGFRGGFAGSMTGKENVRFVARIYGQDVDAVEAFVQDFAEIGDHYYMPVRTYSAGMRARLAFGVSMAIDFDCYLVDEILAVGDAVFRRKCESVFATKLKHADIIMVAHNPGLLKKYCTAGAILQNGRLEYYDDIDKAIAEYNAIIRAKQAALD